MVDQNERNRALVAEFRANQGQVAEETFRDTTLLVLTTKGRKSGRTYENPLAYLAEGDRFVVFASHQGAPEDPDWFKNLMAHPTAMIEVGTDRFLVRPVVLTGAERKRVYGRQAALRPRFAEYERRTTREIPVVALERV
ncbi:MAG: nitroreductase family deazaflavin-dependent oxidoreductase, partial [Acidimicrobiales bacterium]|nr:nitroreductase family deazaflavin-dependent oxidoreductase [Acidimicrobiales bacterium]MBO0886991.1 nitroreductase family deazaflavin-dependent oxidoreductase [Acidimicrobiales bacterium]MBO0894271.1 nitroreductase family deazaflavin-dependent oxidoreductase [Acidimicrobiales bacterium]